MAHPGPDKDEAGIRYKPQANVRRYSACLPGHVQSGTESGRCLSRASRLKGSTKEIEETEVKSKAARRHACPRQPSCFAQDNKLNCLSNWPALPTPQIRMEAVERGFQAEACHAITFNTPKNISTGLELIGKWLCYARNHAHNRLPPPLSQTPPARASSVDRRVCEARC